MIRTYYPTLSIPSLIFFRLQHPSPYTLSSFFYLYTLSVPPPPFMIPLTIHLPLFLSFLRKNKSIILHLPTPFCMNLYFIRVKDELVSYTTSYFTSLAYKTPYPLPPTPPYVYIAIWKWDILKSKHYPSFT